MVSKSIIDSKIMEGFINPSQPMLGSISDVHAVQEQKEIIKALCSDEKFVKYVKQRFYLRTYTDGFCEFVRKKDGKVLNSWNDPLKPLKDNLYETMNIKEL